MTTRNRVLLILMAAAVFTYVVLPGAAGAGRRRALYVDRNSIGGRCSDSLSPAGVSARRPWCSIAKAVALAPSGSRVLVRRGVYGFQDLHWLGSRRRYVTFEPYGFGTRHADQVTIKGIDLAGISYLRFEGFHLVGSDRRGAPLTPAVFTEGEVSHVQFIRNDITGQGIDLEGNPSDALIKGNHIHDLTVDCADPTQVDGSGIIGGGRDVQILHNTISRAPDAAMSFGEAVNLTVADNYVSSIYQQAVRCGRHGDIVELDNHAMGPVRITDNEFSGSQFVLRNASHLRFENNLMIKVDGWMELMADPGARVINNTWWGGNRNCSGCGSLILVDWAPGSGWTKPPFDYTHQMNGTIVENNIMRMFAIDDVPRSQYQENYDMITNTARRDSSGIKGSRTILAHPEFTRDFQLRRRSPGFHAGNTRVAPHGDVRHGKVNMGAVFDRAFGPG